MSIATDLMEQIETVVEGWQLGHLKSEEALQEISEIIANA